jgi:hypothetical protein
MRPDLQERLDATEAFEGKPNPELRRVFEMLSAIPPMPKAMLESHDRQMSELHEQYPNQWVLCRTRWDYDALEAHLDVLGPFPSLGEAVARGDTLSDDDHPYTVMFLEWDAEPVVRLRSPMVIAVDPPADLNR